MGQEENGAGRRRGGNGACRRRGGREVGRAGSGAGGKRGEQKHGVWHSAAQTRGKCGGGQGKGARKGMAAGAMDG